MVWIWFPPLLSPSPSHLPALHPSFPSLSAIEQPKSLNSYNKVQFWTLILYFKFIPNVLDDVIPWALDRWIRGWMDGTKGIDLFNSDCLSLFYWKFLATPDLNPFRTRMLFLIPQHVQQWCKKTIQLFFLRSKDLFSLAWSWC